MNPNRRFIAVFIVLLLLAGCASMGTTPGSTPSASERRTTLNSLLTMKQAYDKAFTTLSLLDQQGKLSASAKANAIKYGNVYLQAHNQAVQDLLDGKRPDLNVVNKALDEFLAQAAVNKKP